MSSPAKLMSTSYIRWCLNDVDADSMGGQINDLCRHKTIDSIGRKINIILCIHGNALRP